MQALFKRFPRRPVRKIIGDVNSKCTGSINDQWNFANELYNNENEILVYENFTWTKISQDQSHI